MPFSFKAAVLAFLLGHNFLLPAQQYVISTYAGGAPQSTPVAATAASIGAPSGVAVDSSDNVYFTGSNCVFRMDRYGVLIRIAGNSRAGYSGDGGPALTAELNNPEGIAVDPSGNLYVADAYNYRVRKISPAGIITTAAVSASTAALNLNGAIAVDTSGNLYLGDLNYHVIRISPAGVFTTIAGTGTYGFSGDGGPANAAQISGASGLATDNAGNLYIADALNIRVRKVSPQGIISTFAGNGSYGASSDGGPATNSKIYSPDAITIDTAGNIYIAGGTTFRISKISNAGIISTVYGGDAVQSTSGSPIGLRVDSTGNVYTSDYFRYVVRRISSGGTVSTAAGNGNFSFSGDGGLATHSRLFGPIGVTADLSGNLYICDTANGRIRVVSPAGIITTIAGNGAYASSGDGGPAVNSQLFRPQSVALDGSGNLYIADANDIGRIRKISADGIITTFAGDGTYGFAGDGGPAISAHVYNPTSLAVDSAGNLYVADAGNNRIRRISTDGIITTIAGTGIFGGSGEGGPAINAQLAHPFSIAVDQTGNLYVYDEVDYDRVTKISPQGILTRVTAKTDIGGPPTSRQQTYFNGLTVDSQGILYFTDSFNQRVRSLSPAGTVTTIAGNGVFGYAGDEGLATAAELFGPIAVTVDPAGNVYVADDYNNAIRRLQPVSASITLTAVANAASNLTGPMAPGETVVLYGSALGPAAFTLGDSGGTTTVTFNGIAATLVYISDAQIAAIAPGSLTGTTVQVSVTSQGQTSKPFSVPIAASAPGLFTLDSTGQGQAVAFNQDGSLNTAANPAAPESSVMLYATGGGQTSGTVTLGGQVLPPFLTSFVAGNGLQLIGLSIPAGVPAGSNVPVTVNIGGASSQAGVTIAIGRN